jgi:hypothetical protein
LTNSTNYDIIDVMPSRRCEQTVNKLLIKKIIKKDKKLSKTY